MKLMKNAEKNKKALKERNKRVHDFLKNNNVGVLSTVDPNGYPHAAVVYYNIDDDFNVGFVTKRETKKSDNIMHNKHVFFIVFDTLSQTTTQLIGFAKDVSDEADSNGVFQSMLKAAYETSDSKMPPISKLYAGPYVAFIIKPTQIRMCVFANAEQRKSMFETIDF